MSELFVFLFFRAEKFNFECFLQNYGYYFAEILVRYRYVTVITINYLDLNLVAPLSHGK